MTSNLVQSTLCDPIGHHQCQNLGQIDHNLHNHVFDDVICKPPIVIGNLNFQKSPKFSPPLKMLSKFK